MIKFQASTAKWRGDH